MNLISQHIREEEKEFDEKFCVKNVSDFPAVAFQEKNGNLDFWNDYVIKSFHRSSSLSLVEKIIGEVRSYKRDVPYCSKVMIDMTKEERDNHFFNLSLESIALLLEQGLEEVKDNK